MTCHDHRNGLDQVAQHIPTSEGSWQEVLELLAEHGFEGMAQAMQMLFNEAMKRERSAVLEAQPYERTPRRRGYANGFKPKTVQTRIGELELAVPQARDVPFYPSALERGQRPDIRVIGMEAQVGERVQAGDEGVPPERVLLMAALTMRGRFRHFLEKSRLPLVAGRSLAMQASIKLHPKDSRLVGSVNLLLHYL